jgi:ATP-binding cassette subfamily B protein
MSYFDRNPVGRLVTRLTTDVDVLQEMFSSGVMTLISDFVMVFWIIGIMFYLHVELALVSLALIPPMAVAINFFRVKARQTYRQIRERIARINAYLAEAISGMGVIQIFAREEKSYREFDKLNSDHREAYHLSNLYEASLYSMVEAAGSVSVALLLWYGGGEVLHGVIGTARWLRSKSTSTVSLCRCVTSARNMPSCSPRCPRRSASSSFSIRR